MKNIFTAAVLALGLLVSAPFAMAQVVAQPMYANPAYFCPQLSYNLYQGLGDRNTAGQVTSLQQFLTTRYSQPVTGYFGALTHANVARFQQEQGVYPITGGVGPLTRAAIARVCNTTTGGTTQTIIYPNQQFTLGIGGTANYFQGGLNVTLNSTSQANSNWWTPWTAQTANVTLGYSCPPGLYCTAIYYPQQQLTLTQGQSTQFQGYAVTLTSVANNSATFVVTQTANTQQPTVTSINPTQGAVGTQVTIYGTGFTQNNNTVRFGFGAIPNLSSYNGASITFTVPEYLNPSCFYSNPRCLIATQQTTPGSYAVSVENANGQSGTTNFTVTQQQNASIVITSPSGGQSVAHGQNMAVSWTVNNTPTNSAVVVDLYTTTGNRVGTVAINSNSSNGFNWIVPTPSTICTQQYPNGLCGMSLSGQYYLKVSLVVGNGFEANPAIYSSATSGTFTIY